MPLCRALLVCTAALCSLLVVAGCRSPQKEVSATPKSVEELATALGASYRPLHGRLTGGFGFAPCSESKGTANGITFRAGGASAGLGIQAENLIPDISCSSRRVSLDSNRQDVLALTRSSLSHTSIGALDSTYRGLKSSEPPSIRDLHLAAVAELAYAEGSDPDRAISLLEAALAVEPENPLLLADLSAAYLLRAQRRDLPRDLWAAITTASKAVEIAPEMPEAIFNYATALGFFIPTVTEKKAWEKYLQLDSSSEFGVEARIRLDAIDGYLEAESWEELRRNLLDSVEEESPEELQDIVSRFPRDVWYLITETLLPEWANNGYLVHGHIESKNCSASSRLADALAAATGDLLLRSIGFSCSPTDASRGWLEALRELFQSAWRNLEPDELEALRNLHLQQGNPYWLWIQEALGHRYYALERYELSLEAYRSLIDAIQDQPFPMLLARGYWMSGLNKLVLGKYSTALNDYRKSLAIYEEMGDPEGRASILRLIAELFFLLGDDHAAADYHYRSLRILPRLPSHPVRISMLASLSRMLPKSEATLALALHNEMFRVAEATQHAPGLVDSLTFRALDYYHLGDTHRAISDVEAASVYLSEVSPPSRRSRQMADLLLVEATVRADNAAAAIEATDRALAHYRQTKNHFYLIPTLLIRANAYLQQDQPDLAQQSIDSGLSEIQGGSQTIDDPRFRVLYRDHMRSFIDSRVELLLDRGNHLQALRASDSARASSLLEQLRGLNRVVPSSRTPKVLDGTIPDLKALQRSIPSGTLLVAFWLGRSRGHAWAIMDQEFVPYELDLTAEATTALVRRYSNQLQRDKYDPERQVLGTQLFSILLGPAKDLLATATALVVVPDGSLSLLPFAALPLVEAHPSPIILSHQVSMAPSVALANALPENETLPISQVKDVTVLSSSAPLTFGSSSLPPLPYAEQEAIEIRRIYSSARARENGFQVTTQSDFVAALGESEIIHFAGHSLYSTEYSTDALLFLSGGKRNREPHWISSWELLKSNSWGTKLVVLASCQSLDGPHTDLEGPIGLSRALLSAGTQRVLGTLWPISDEGSSRFFPELHEGIASGLSPEEALREAQVSAIHNELSPETWAAPVLYRTH